MSLIAETGLQDDPAINPQKVLLPSPLEEYFVIRPGRRRRTAWLGGGASCECLACFLASSSLSGRRSEVLA